MPNDGGVGTNLRTYNKESESWDIARWQHRNDVQIAATQSTAAHNFFRSRGELLEMETGNVL